ncbi:hypothetical protein [Thiohalomonas denitrificans]|uniref:Uncharacterized protein n=1 Tax=Thiohalomonas denitrificans TaxID=415747 RepID=A0A1G5PV35_9GAMM|nr:hypothetical protein [Thiohalomonas denitrificans]SCZ52899.1 hypothetical protein SAMN03097708_00827 [Thiohalomonas denitrificans]
MAVPNQAYTLSNGFGQIQNREFTEIPGQPNTSRADEALTSDWAPHWIKRAISRLERIAALPQNWDSYGALTIASENIKVVIEALMGLCSAGTPEPSIVPTPSGGVQIEWHTNGIDLEIEVVRPTQIEVLFEDHKNGNEWEGSVSYDLRHLKTLIEDLSAEENPA